MKIRAIDTTILSVPTPTPIALEYPEHRLVVASIETDEGPSGLGYSLVFGAAGAESIQVYLETRLKALLIGEDPRVAAYASSPPPTRSRSRRTSSDLFIGLPRCKDGQLPISDRPGHGLALVPGAEKKYRFTM
jgi:L-alanine-DL-glutamate epimerase-like enolase superfamily enzyme